MKYVLYVHQSSELYGSDKVLAFIVHAIKARGVYHPIVVLPERGKLFDLLVKVGCEVHVGEVVKLQRSSFTFGGVLRVLGRLHKCILDLDSIVSGRKIWCVHSNTIAVVGGAYWAWRRGVANVWHVHEIIASPKFAAYVFPWLVRLLSRRVIAISAATAGWLIGICPSLQAKAQVIHNGLPSSAALASFEMAVASEVEIDRRSFGFDSQCILLGIVGRVNAWKGHNLLFDAIQLIVERGLVSNIGLIVVGDSPPGQGNILVELKRRCSTSGLDGVIRFMPFVLNIDRVWSILDIAIVPSTSPEPFGMVAIEAMAAGLPVIAADHGGLSDIVQNDVTGIAFKPGDVLSLCDAIVKLCDSSEIRRRFGEAGFARQRALYSVEAQVARITEVYDGIH